MKTITVDSRQPFEIQREQFYHELCHILRHAGSQLMMPRTFIQLQEWGCKPFYSLCCHSIHMLSGFNLRDPDIVPVLSQVFGVTEKLCQERVANATVKHLVGQVAEDGQRYKA